MSEETNKADDPAASADRTAERTVKKLHYIIHMISETNQIIKIEEFDEGTQNSRELPLPLFLTNEPDEELTDYSAEETDQPFEFEYDWPPQYYGPTYPQGFFGYPMGTMWPMNPWPAMPPPCAASPYAASPCAAIPCAPGFPTPPPRFRARSKKDAAFSCSKTGEISFSCSKTGGVSSSCSKVGEISFSCSKTGEVSSSCSKVGEISFSCSKTGEAASCSKTGEILLKVGDVAAESSEVRRSGFIGTKVRTSGTVGAACFNVKFKPNE